MDYVIRAHYQPNLDFAHGRCLIVSGVVRF